MKTGDKVRFLSETGGGVVAGFQGKNIVLVEDEDGFQIPVRINDVVVVDTDDYNIKIDTPNKQENQKDEDYDPADRPVTFHPEPEERNGGDSLSAYLAFVPVNDKEITQTPFEAYIVNDSNYYICYTYLSAEGATWHLRSGGEIEPNTKLFIEEIDRDMLNSIERVCIQLIAYKRNKPFMIKPVIDARLRVDTVKFYKLHTFKENDFFEQPALLYTIVENDQPVRPLVIDAKKLKQEMAQKIQNDNNKRTVMPAKKSRDKNAPIIIDLHANELLETTAGLTAADILNHQLDVFRKTMDEYKNKVGTRLIFIHGKGEGVLRHAIIHELNYKYKKCQYQDASFQEYGYGATQVTVKL